MLEVSNYKPLVISELIPSMHISLVNDSEGLREMREWLGAQTEKIIGIDTETNVVVDFYFRRIRTIQLGNKNRQFVIDLLSFSGSEENLINSQGFYGKNNGNLYTELKEVLDPVLCSNEWLKVGQNLAYEYEVLKWNMGMRIWHLYSTDLAERVLQAGVIYFKRYAEFSMEALTKRYFDLQIDKSHQTTFDLKSPLTKEQIEYAALDIRMPLALRLLQMKRLLSEQLLTTATIENDAIGSFTDMHLNGQNLDDARWMRRVAAVKERRIEELKTLDKGFIPIVGLKSEAIDHELINRLEKKWREGFQEATTQEMEKASQARLEHDPVKKIILKEELEALKKGRTTKKAKARAAYSEKSKERTKKTTILEKCEGEAFINYGSNKQLLEALKTLLKNKNLSGVGDDVLLKYNDLPLIQTLRSYNKGKKSTGTYGEMWTRRWTTHPCKEEGWRHPGDGRLHCKFNQLEAETGRTSSEKPNAQNLPKDDEVRACFICDKPDENIRISICCEDYADFAGSDYDAQGNLTGILYGKCHTCGQIVATKPEEYVIVTVDMSGAELRIIAELANAKSWIVAFAKDQDVHSVSTEILYPEVWPTLACKGGEKWFNPETKEEEILPPCKYYQKADERKVLPNGEVIEAGDMLKKKCKCPGHVELRNGTKELNFLLCYGGGPDALADALGTSVDKAKEIMKLHESKFPDVWGYLRRSGDLAKEHKEARDMYGRRRAFPEPTPETAYDWFIEYESKKLELDEDEQEVQIFNFKAKEMREPNKEELYKLTHREPNSNDIRQAIRAMMGSIGRQGKNHCIQGTNASIAKRAMGCGFNNGRPYLWHTLPKYKALLLNMVHDELVIQCPKRYGKQVMALVGEAFRMAASEVMKKVVMNHEGHIAERWMK